MLYLSGYCQKENANRNFLLYALKEFYHMYAFSKHVRI